MPFSNKKIVSYEENKPWVPKKLKIELPYDSAILLLGIHLKETLIWKDICTPVFTEALLAITKTCNHPKWSRRDERIKKMWYIYIYNVCIYVYVCPYYYIYIYIILFSHKKEWNNATFSNIGGHRDYHTKWNKSEKDRYHLISLICII